VAEVCTGEDPIECGPAEDVGFDDLVHLVAETVGFRGAIVLERANRPAAAGARPGARTLEQRGWRPSIGLADGIRELHRAWRHQVSAAASRGSAASRATRPAS
jgi:GDP-L-fucose synthase